MFRELSPTRAAATFYALAVLLVTVVAATGGSTAAAMLTPAVATLLMLLLVTREGRTRAGWASLGLHRLGLRSWAPAVLIPLAVVAAGGAVLVAAGGAFGTSGQAAALPWWLLPGALLLNIAYASLTVSLTEEVGWRGYLLPRLSRLGARRALLLSGVLHGLWHLPVILLTDLYHPLGNRLVVIPLFLVTVAAAGVFLGWLRLRSGSLWPAVVAHSAHNVAVAWLGLTVTGNALTAEYLAGDSGAVTAFAYVALAAVLLRRVGGSSGGPQVQLPSQSTASRAPVTETRSHA